MLYGRSIGVANDFHDRVDVGIWQFEDVPDVGLVQVPQVVGVDFGRETIRVVLLEVRIV